MVHLNQELKANQKCLDFATAIWGSIYAHKGNLNPTTRRSIQGNIREINDKFYMEHTAGLADKVKNAGLSLDENLTCSGWFNMHRDLKSFYGSKKVIHREHINGGVKSMCDYLILNYESFENPQDVLDYVVDNTHFIARLNEETHINEHTTLEEIKQYI